MPSSVLPPSAPRSVALHRALLALGCASLAACSSAPGDTEATATGTTQGAFSIPINGGTLAPTYPGKVATVDPSSRDQTPARTASLHVPLAAAGHIISLSVNVELGPATVRVNDSDVVLPPTFTGDFDEASISLVSPSGKQIRVTDPIALRYGSGKIPAPLPLSSYNRLKSVSAVQSLEIYRPVMGGDGLPLLDAAGNARVRSVPCASASWLQDSETPSRVFPRCPTASASTFKSQVGSDLRFAGKTVSFALFDEVAGDEAYGDWTLVVTDPRPLRNDTLGVTGSAAPLVSRFAIKSFSLMPFTTYAPLPTTPVATRAFANEPSTTAPVKKALGGASGLVASGIQMDQAAVWFKIKRTGAGPLATPTVVLYNPQGKVSTLKAGLVDDAFYEVPLGTTAAPFPPGSKGAPVDGRWHLQVTAWDATSATQKDYSSDYTLDWGMKVTGPLTRYVAVQEPTAPLTIKGKGEQTFTFDVKAGARVARDLWIELGTDNLWAFRHRLTVTPPGGSAADAIHACTAGQDPAAAHCLRVDASGRSVRIALPKATAMTGTWSVRWQVDQDAAAADDLGVQVIGGCAPEVSPASLARQVIAARLRAQTVTLLRVKLGLSETRLTDALFAYQVLDEAESRPHHTFMIDAKKRYAYNIERVRLDREYWDAYNRARAVTSTSNTGYQDLSALLDAAIGDDNLRQLGAIEDGMFAAWAPRGSLDVYAGRMHSARLGGLTLPNEDRLTQADLGIRLMAATGMYAGMDFPLTDGLVRWIGSFNDGTVAGALTSTALTIGLLPVIAFVPLAEDASHGGIWGPFIEKATEPVAKDAPEKAETEHTEASNAKTDDTSKDGTTKEDEAPKPGEEEPAPPKTEGEMCPDYAYECASSAVTPAELAAEARMAKAVGLVTMHTIAPYAICEDGPCGTSGPKQAYVPGWQEITDPTTPYINCGPGSACTDGASGGGAPSVCLDWILNKGFTDPAPFLHVPGVPVMP